MIEIKTAQNLETHVLNNTDIQIQKDQSIEIKGRVFSREVRLDEREYRERAQLHRYDPD